jgi:hypothetical protein
MIMNNYIRIVLAETGDRLLLAEAPGDCPVEAGDLVSITEAGYQIGPFPVEGEAFVNVMDDTLAILRKLHPDMGQVVAVFKHRWAAIEEV